MLAVLENREQLENRGEASPDGDITEFWRALPARAASVRHLALPADPAENDVVDPYRRGEEIYHQMEDELAPAILGILRFARLTAPA